MAGRIPQAFLDTLLDRVDIVEVVDRRVKLKKTGKNYSARCPFHDDSSPSFHVYPDTWSYHCFGCAANGTGFNFIMAKEGLTFSEALRKLADRAGVTIEERRVDPVQKERQSRLAALTEAAAGFFTQQLRDPVGDGA